MKPKDKKKWIAALRSGEYEQCGSWLHRETRFCCLGVAADIFEDAWWVQSDKNWRLLVASGRYKDCWYNPPGVPDHAVEKLMKLNDEGFTFSEIADWIEKNL